MCDDFFLNLRDISYLAFSYLVEEEWVGRLSVRANEKRQRVEVASR